jgi:predicted MFS family arabinose efflux permease
LAFGVKHMAIPIAGLLAGISVPLVALNIGWRWAYGIGLMMPVITLVVIAATGREQPGTLPDMPDMPRTRAVRGQIADVPAMFGLAAAGGLAAGAVGALSAFFVESAVRGGTAEGLAGAWFAVGSAVGLAVRPAVGWLSDRRSGSSLRGTAALLGMGAVGFAMLAVRSGPILPVATVIAFGAGWGWPGLYHHAVVDHNPDAAAAATGVALVGLSLGGAFGPSLFGLLAHNASFESAWLATALVALTAAGLAEATRLRFRRAPGTHPTYETIE